MAADSLSHVFNAKHPHSTPSQLRATTWLIEDDVETVQIYACCWCCPQISLVHEGTMIEVRHRTDREDARDV